MKLKGLSIAAWFAPFLLLLVSARADLVLYGTTGGTGPGNLYTIDPATGAATVVGPLVDNLAKAYSVTGLAFDSATGVLYGSTSNQSPTASSSLVTIDPSSGHITVVGSLGIFGTLADLTFNSANNTVYGTGSLDSNLYSVNLANGQATSLGPSGNGGGAAGVGVAAFNGTIYGAPNGANGSLVTYNISNGAATVMQSLTGAPYGSSGSISALAFNPSGVLYGSDLDRNTHAASLITIDVATGLTTDIGLSVNGLDAIVFSEVPEPSTWLSGALAFAGIAFISYRRLRRRRICSGGL